MKFLISLSILLGVITSAQAQNTQPVKAGLPPFDIQLANGNHYRASDLNKDQPVMVVYFDPDCDHCRIFIDGFLKNIDLFNQVQVVFVTYVPLQRVKEFVTSDGLDKYPQIKVGTEGNSFIVRYHYNVAQFPYVALHKQNGDLIATYESEVPPPAELAKELRK
jgi:hypothetical protein